MKITIIIPSLNEAAHIVHTLKPLQALRQRGHQIILCDAHSHDNTRQLAQPWVDAIINTETGRARQMNAGAQQAKHDILWFLHADTYVPDNADTIILHHLTSRSCIWGRFNIRLSGHSWLFRIIEKMMNWRSCLSGIATGDQGIFVNKAIFEQLGCYETIPLMEDIELSKKLKKISRPICINTPLITSSRRWEQQGIVRTVLLMWYLRLAYFLGTPSEKLARCYRQS